MNVYVLSRERTSEAVWRFTRQYVDVVAGFDRGDEELMVHPIRKDDAASFENAEKLDAPLGFDDYDWIPSHTLANAINLGVSVPWRAFLIPLLPPRWPGVRSISIGFTTDGAVVFGLQIDGLDAAKEQLEQLLTNFNWKIALLSESRSPSSEAEALAMAKDAYTVLCRVYEAGGQG